jgi:hypothetical protein
MTPAGTSTFPEWTGTSPPSPTTGLTRPGGATPSVPAGPPSGSGSLPATAAAARHPATASHHLETGGLPGTDMAAHRPATDTAAHRPATDTAAHRPATDTTVPGPAIGAAHRPRRPMLGRRPAVPVTSTRPTHPRCAALGPAAGVTRARFGLATSSHPDPALSQQPASGAPLQARVAGRAALGCDLAHPRGGLASCRPCPPRPAGLTQGYAARFSLPGIAPAGSGQECGNPALPPRVRFLLRRTRAGRLVLALCRPLLQVSPSPVRGGPHPSRCPSSGPAGSWRSALSVPG